MEFLGMTRSQSSSSTNADVPTTPSSATSYDPSDSDDGFSILSSTTSEYSWPEMLEDDGIQTQPAPSRLLEKVYGPDVSQSVTTIEESEMVHLKITGDSAGFDVVLSRVKTWNMLENYVQCLSPFKLKDIRVTRVVYGEKAHNESTWDICLYDISCSIDAHTPIIYVDLAACVIEHARDIARVATDNSLPFVHMDLGVINVLPQNAADPSASWETYQFLEGPMLDLVVEIDKPSAPTIYGGQLVNGMFAAHRRYSFQALRPAWLMKVIEFADNGRWYRKKALMSLEAQSVDEDLNKLIECDIRTLGAVAIIEKSELGEVNVDRVYPHWVECKPLMLTIGEDSKSYRVFRDVAAFQPTLLR